MSSEKSPATPVPAATILLLRDSEISTDLEVFMVVRHHQIDFASGALVFPGGKAHAHDRDPGVRDLCDGAENATDVELSLMVAAIREAFEESGVLLARAGKSSEFVDADLLESLDRFRGELDKGDLPILEFLKANDLRLACDALTRYSHWVTPEFMPKRFDTHFYLAIPPSFHNALHDGSETVDSVWISPQQALSDADEGKRTIIFPTRMNLQKLAESSNADEAILHAQQRKISPVMPFIETRNEEPYLCLPSDAGYGDVAIPAKEM